MSNIQFPEGIQVYAKSPKAPEWVGDSIVIEKAKLTEWLKSQGEKVRLQIATGKTGKKYLKVDTYEPKQSGNQPATPANTVTVTNYNETEDLPF